MTDDARTTEELVTWVTNAKATLGPGWDVFIAVWPRSGSGATITIMGGSHTAKSVRCTEGWTAGIAAADAKIREIVEAQTRAVDVAEAYWREMGIAA